MRTTLMLALSLIIVACSEDAADTISSAQEESSPVEVANIQTKPSDSYEEARDAAITAISNATKKGHAWSTSDQLIKDAADAAVGGEETRAIALADEARIQAELASAQADREAIAWRDNVISK